MELTEQDFSCKTEIDGLSILLENPNKADLYRLAHWAVAHEDCQYASSEGLIRFWFHKDKGLIAFSGDTLIHSSFENDWGFGTQEGCTIGGYIDIFTRERHDTKGKAFAVRHMQRGQSDEAVTTREEMVRNFQTFLLCHVRIRLKEEEKR